MIRSFFAAASALLLVAGAALPAAAQAQSNLNLVDTDDFARQWEKTRTLEDAARVAAIKAYFEPIIPGFYSHERHGLPDATRYDSYLLKALKEFPEQRAAIQQMSRRFTSLLAPAEASFEREFGPMTGFREIYLVHSLGEFDGGMRTLAGKGYLMFGADVMARIYATRRSSPSSTTSCSTSTIAALSGTARLCAAIFGTRGLPPTSRTG